MNLRFVSLFLSLGMVGCGPDHVHVERSTSLSATPADVYPHLADLRKFVVWSPWSDIDPNSVTDFSNPSTGIDAWYSWKGNSDVGSGKMTVIAEQENAMVKHRLDFVEPWTGSAEATLTMAVSDDTVTVTWGYDQDNDFAGKVMGTFIDMDDMLGGDFEKGLGRLAVQVEQTVAARKEAEARQQAEAAKQAEADAAAADIPDDAPVAE